MRVGSLFSGAGLGDLGLEWAGFEHAWFCEQDGYATKVLNLRWPGVPVYDDVCTIDPENVEPIDVLIGGFPCQDVSSAGKRKGIIKGETRSGLFYELIRCVRALRPKYVIVENVSALLTDGLGTVLGELASVGYDAEWQVLPSAMFGAPHLRERVFVVAYPMRKRGEPSKQAIFTQNGNMGNMLKLDSIVDWCGKRINRETIKAEREIHIQSGVCRMDDGVAEWVDRLGCCGNGIVPHCTYFIGRLIMEHATMKVEAA